MTLSGKIIDVQTGKPVQNATWQEVYYQAENKMLTPFGPVFPVNQSVYQIDVDSISDQQYFQFTAPGYNIYYANDVSLQSDSTVKLLKEDNKNLILAGSALAILLLSQKKNAVGKMTVEDVKPYILIGGVLVVTGLFKKLLTSLGVYDSAATVALDQAATNPKSFWNPTFWQQFSSFPNGSLTSQQAGEKLWAIDNAFGTFSDDVSAVNAVFHSLTSQSELSYMAFVAQQIFKQDLLTYLRGTSWPNDRLSDSEVQAINTFISKLPTN